jgi:hypothetical protein
MGNMSPSHVLPHKISPSMSSLLFNLGVSSTTKVGPYYTHGEGEPSKLAMMGSGEL